MTRSQSTARKKVPKKRKKVAPKLVSTRPNRTQPTAHGSNTSQEDTQPPDDQSIPSTSTDNVNVISPTATTKTRPLQALSQSHSVPLPTLPSEGASNSIPTPLQLPEAELSVGELFTDEQTETIVNQGEGIGVELLVPQTTSPLDTTKTNRTIDKEANRKPLCQDDVTTKEKDGRSTSVSTTGEATSVEGTVAERSEVVASGNTEVTAGKDGTGSKKKSPPRSRSSRKRRRSESREQESCEKESTPPPARRRRQPVAKERKAPDRSTMTMQELIYYNPTANPMQAAREDREKRRGSTATPSPEKDTPTQQSETCQTTSPTNSEGKEERIVPQLRIGNDGNIIIDESSMMMSTTQTASPYSEAVEETSGQVTSDSFRKCYKITRWSKDETGKFFKALSHVGTDFTMMTLLVPNRSRKELKNKFKREEKKSPQLIAQALKNQIKVTKVAS
ncbi:transcription factor TFIIIB component B'' homolog isoform X2 [Halichondria panicea]|uniref:transcription factor TFIIIB component B'' homolog isoform X2 n=1 Tax=Halichondria panicea TaxID=6063 RepID=UPI00312BABC1